MHSLGNSVIGTVRTLNRVRDVDLARIAKPQGAPRGLLLHFILHKISLEPSHGYEILQEIEEKTSGAWRPGPGSIYPMLKKLVSQGYIKSESSRKVKTAQRVYQITPKGKAHIQKIRKIFTNAGERWSSLARIFIDMLEPSDLSKFFVEGSKKQFEIARETLESRIDRLRTEDAEFMMKEYALNLQRQLEWCNAVLRGLRRGHVVETEARIASK
jgi:DNA-binding PadR family transcriptional regulator